MVGTRHVLGLAVDDSGVVATEMSMSAGRPTIRRTGELLWEQEFTGDNAKELGQQLRKFLHDHGFSAKKVAVGLAAKWVLAKEISVPPAGPEALAGVLSIQAERAFSINADELIFDYCGKARATEKSQILLLAARRQTVHLIQELAATAGLHVSSVTVSALSCGKALAGASSTYRYGLYARPTYCELWGQLNGSPRFVKHVPMDTEGGGTGYADLLTSTIQRHILLSPAPDQSPPYEVMAYDACGQVDGVLNRLNERLAPRIKLRDGRDSPICRELGLADASQESRSVAAVAVASTAVATERPAVDFLNPRIGGKKITGHKRVVGWAVFVGIVCFVALAAALADWNADRRDIATYTEQLEQMSDDIAAAQTVVDRISYASSWGSREPHFLDCLRELTLAFPEEGSVWATSLALNENGTGSLVGKAASEPRFYEVLDRIKRNQAFSNVQMIHIRNAGRDSGDKEFAINFTFEGLK